MRPKALRARELGVSRGSLYYQKKKPNKDWQLKCRIEEVLREHPSYGSRRIAWHLKLNRKGVRRVMNLFGIKATGGGGRSGKRRRISRLFTRISCSPLVQVTRITFGWRTSPTCRFRARRCMWPRWKICIPGRSSASRCIPPMPFSWC